MRLLVAVIGAAHGLKGEVKLDVCTDVPEERFVPGTEIETEPAAAGPLRILSVRFHRGGTYAKFEQISDRTAAESLRGVQLVIESDETAQEEDAWYEHELLGLEALDPQGRKLGTVSGLQPMPAQDLLLVTEPGGRVVQVPFVKEIVTEVDPEGRRAVIDAPCGLFSQDGPQIGGDAAEKA